MHGMEAAPAAKHPPFRRRVDSPTVAGAVELPPAEGIIAHGDAGGKERLRASISYRCRLYNLIFPCALIYPHILIYMYGCVLIYLQLLDACARNTKTGTLQSDERADRSSRTCSTQIPGVCVECLIGKQKKQILVKVTEPSSVPYRAPSACAKRAAYPDPVSDRIIRQSDISQSVCIVFNFISPRQPGFCCCSRGMNISRQGNGRAYDITCCWNAGASAFDELEHIITVPQ